MIPAARHQTRLAFSLSKFWQVFHHTADRLQLRRKRPTFRPTCGINRGAIPDALCTEHRLNEERAQFALDKLQDIPPAFLLPREKCFQISGNRAISLSRENLELLLS